MHDPMAARLLLNKHNRGDRSNVGAGFEAIAFSAPEPSAPVGWSGMSEELPVFRPSLRVRFITSSRSARTAGSGRK
eukprot:scaffold111388_cov24-Attheya_sp.AAC.1